MRSLLFIPIAVVLVCACGYAGCALLGWQPYPREMLVAAGTTLAAGLAAMAPLLIVRSTSSVNSANVAQAALVGTMIHLFVCVGVAAVVLLMKMPLAPAFTFWLLACYSMTLIALAAGLVAEVRIVAAAGMQSQPHKQ